MSLGTRLKKGFGILEVLLAGVIIITMLGALVFVARTTINNTVYSMQKGQAAYLAQEGMEIVRQIRDSNYIDGRGGSEWNTIAGDDSTLRVKTVGEIGIDRPYCIRKKLNNDNIRYHMVDCTDAEIDPQTRGQVNIDGTVYTRYIYFYSSGGKLLSLPTGIDNFLDNSYRVHIVISWSDMGRDRELVVDEVITNSRQAW